MSKKRSSTTTSNSSSAIDPWQRQQWEGLYGQAKTIAADPYKKYEGPIVAGFNSDQLNAFDAARTAATGNVGGAALDQAMGGARSAMAYQPAQVTGTGYTASTFGGANAGPAATASAASINRGDIRDVSAGSILDQDVGAYMNPFLRNVAANAMSDLERTRQIQQIQGGNAARAAGAFGGSRHGVADAETNRNFYDVAGKTLTNLYSSGYDNALGLAGQDLARGFQAQTANQGVDATVAGRNADFTQQTGLANQNAANNMAQFNATLQQQAGMADAAAVNEASRYGADNDMRAQLANQTAGYNAANLGLSAATQLAGLSDQERRNTYQDAAMLEQIGGTQQAQTQREYDMNLARWQDEQGESLRDLGLQASILSGMPILGQSSTGTSTGTQSPSAADTAKGWISAIGSLIGFSDRNIKKNIRPADGDAALRGIEKMPVSTWQYDAKKGGPADGATYTGPMAQDMSKNLGLGNGKMFPVTDAIGTQFAATKALAAKVKKLEAKTKKGTK